MNAVKIIGPLDCLEPPEERQTRRRRESPSAAIDVRISLESVSAKAHFAILQKQRAKIDARIPRLLWDERPDDVQSYIGVYLDDTHMGDEIG